MAFSITSHEMQPTVTNVPLFPISLIPFCLTVSAAGKARDHFQLCESDATLRPPRRGGSDTEQWASSLQKDAAILQESLAMRGKLRFNFPV